ncbi:MAG TPA: glycosyl transferase family protein [Novosphingobium sp.]|nr:glycosyl transferase family protein [Novosphingobium sp.]
MADAIQGAIKFLQLGEQELLLFAAFWFLLGAIDDIAVDLCWICLKLTGRARTGRISGEQGKAPLVGRAAILIAAWQEEQVIGHTVRHALSVWQQDDFILYVGCYCNDPATVSAAMSGAGNDPRVRIVIHENAGPTTKADCLNRLYSALCNDERRYDYRFKSIVLHDSEDMVHPAELAVIDSALSDVDFVQLPVRPEPQPASRWVGGHYSDEFTESHAKALVVRDALGAAIPAAGVACGFSRDIMERIAERRRAEGGPGPFASECLTEDYELGVLVRREGGRSRFLRMRDENAQLVATRAYFPAQLEDSVRQKTRWIHGIAFQGWDRLGWGARPSDCWMALRDRRGPLTAIVLACGYALLAIEGILGLARLSGLRATTIISPMLNVMLVLCFASFVWRGIFRVAFTAREYGPAEGIRALFRIPVANLIAIVAGRRALWRYIRTLRGAAITWDKTRHDVHPANSAPVGISR